MVISESLGPDQPEDRSSTEDLVSQIKTILEENDPTITVEEIIPRDPPGGGVSKLDVN